MSRKRYRTETLLLQTANMASDRVISDNLERLSMSFCKLFRVWFSCGCSVLTRFRLTRRGAQGGSLQHNRAFFMIDGSKLGKLRLHKSSCLAHNVSRGHVDWRAASNDEFTRWKISLGSCQCVVDASKCTYTLYTVTRPGQPSITPLIAGHVHH